MVWGFRFWGWLRLKKLELELVFVPVVAAHARWVRQELRTRIRVRHVPGCTSILVD